MGDKDIEIELIANSAPMAISNARLITGGNAFSNETYKIGDMIVYSRRLHVKGGMES